MFKKFNATEDIVGSQQLKGSVQKSIRTKILETYPNLEPYIESVLAKKENFRVIKCKEHLELVADNQGFVQFFKHRDFPYIPTLRLLHQFPFMLPHQQVDKGAIKFVLNGADIMCPGLTSAGGRLLEDCSVDTVVAVMAQDKQHAVAIAQMKLSPSDIRATNKGIAMESIHFLGDGLWRSLQNPLT